MRKFYFFVTLFVSFLIFGQKKDSVNIENQRLDFKYNKLYIPAGLMVGGLLTDLGKNESIEKEILEERTEHVFGFHHHIDDYVQFAPYVAAYAFEWAGMKPRTDWKNRTAIMIKAQIINLGIVYILKKIN